MLRLRTHWYGLISGVVVWGLALVVVPRMGVATRPELAENRVLASWPDWPRSLSEFGRFRVAVEAYTNDHFPSRVYLIGGLNYLRYLAGYSGTARVLVGKNGWLFYENGSHLALIRPSDLPAAATHAWASEFKERRTHLQDSGIPYIVVAAPVKESIYPGLVPRPLRAMDAGPGDAALLRETVDLPARRGFVDLSAPLRRARDSGTPVYSPLDTHWTGEGAYVAYRTVLAEIARQGVSVVAHPRSSFFAPPAETAVPQDMAYMLGIAAYARQDFPQLTGNAAAHWNVHYLTPATDWTADRIIDTGSSGPVLLLTGDSFCNVWMPLLAESFSRIVFSHHQNGFHRKDLIERFHPDVVLLEVIESGIRHAMPEAAPTERHS